MAATINSTAAGTKTPPSFPPQRNSLYSPIRHRVTKSLSTRWSATKKMVVDAKTGSPVAIITAAHLPPPHLVQAALVQLLAGKGALESKGLKRPHLLIRMRGSNGYTLELRTSAAPHTNRPKRYEVPVGGNPQDWADKTRTLTLRAVGLSTSAPSSEITHQMVEHLGKTMAKAEHKNR